MTKWRPDDWQQLKEGWYAQFQKGNLGVCAAMENVADAMLEAYQEYLALQMGEKSPCEGCRYGPVPCKWAKPGLKSKAQACGPYSQWVGYALGLQERNKAVLWLVYDVLFSPDAAPYWKRDHREKLVSLLESKGIKRVEKV